MTYLGDFAEDAAVYFAWDTFDANGASCTRTVDGTISVYKDASNGTAFDTTQVTTGVTNDEDFDALTGIHTCSITTTDVWYATGHDYMVVLSGSTIDGQTVNAIVAHFSIENRYTRGTDSANTTVPDVAGTAATLHATTDGKIDTVDTNVDTILVDTNELQTDWTNGGRLDLILDIIAADTTTDIPTLINTLNNLSSADVNAACDTALADANLDKHDRNMKALILSGV